MIRSLFQRFNAMLLENLFGIHSSIIIGCSTLLIGSCAYVERDRRQLDKGMEELEELGKAAEKLEKAMEKKLLASAVLLRHHGSMDEE